MLKMFYYLVRNTRGQQVSYRPNVVAREGNFDDMVAVIAGQTGQSREVVRAVLVAAGPALGERAVQGIPTDWPDLGYFRPGLTDATVDSPDAQLPPTARGMVSLSVRGALRELLDNVQYERTEAPADTPVWDSVTAEVGTIHAVTDRTILKIQGQHLDFTATRADEGLFLHPQDDSAMQKATVIRHSAQRIDAQAPTGLAPGTDCWLELHTRGLRGAASHELEIYLWPGTLTTA